MNTQKSNLGRNFSLALILLGVGLSHGAGVIAGTLKLWYPVTITFDGPAGTETPATFRNNRLEVTFTQGNKSIKTLGYFAADGNAGETGATAGNKWRVKFTPNMTGAWTYIVSFRTGTDIAASLEAAAGTAAAPDGETGTFTVLPKEANAPGFYAKGILKYVGEHYLQFEGSKEWFIKGGPGSPENLMGYHEFDGTTDNGGMGPATASGLHEWPSHVADWKVGDPTWKNGKGKAIIGAMNYIASKGNNTFYFIPMGSAGDGKDSWPWTSDRAFDTYDVSKLDQWEIVLRHMDAIGINKDYYLWENENTRLVDGGALGVQRRIYYREIIARFSHLLAIRWNIGEEPSNTEADRLAEMAHVQMLDSYDHAVGIHNNVDETSRNREFTPLLGKPYMDGAWTQTHSDWYGQTLKWINASKAAGKKWVVSVDESTAKGVNAQDAARMEFWETTMAGGEGYDVYFGYGGAVGDCDDENFHARSATWDAMGHGVKFFMDERVNSRLVRNGGVVARPDLGNRVLANEAAPSDAVYIIKNPSTTLNMAKATGSYLVWWYDAKAGGVFKQTGVTTVTGGGTVTLGAPPAAGTDWVVIVYSATSVSMPKSEKLGAKEIAFSLNISHSNTLVLNYTLAEPSSVSIDMLNARGEISNTLLKYAQQGVGKQLLLIDASQFKPGIYFFRIKMETRAGTREFIRPLAL